MTMTTVYLVCLVSASGAKSIVAALSSQGDAMDYLLDKVAGNYDYEYATIYEVPMLSSN